MGKLSAALGFGDVGAADEGDSSDESLTPSVKPEASASAEVLAMKQFKRATTPEAMASALKDFAEACGWTTGDSY